MAEYLVDTDYGLIEVNGHPSVQDNGVLLILSEKTEDGRIPLWIFPHKTWTLLSPADQKVISRKTVNKKEGGV